MMKKTKEAAKQWIEAGNPCFYQHGLSFRGACKGKITKEKALELLPKYSFGMGFYELYWVNEGLVFNELGENDLY